MNDETLAVEFVDATAVKIQLRNLCPDHANPSGDRASARHDRER